MRRLYTAAERRRFLDEVREGGEPVAVVARRLGIGVSTAYLWHQRANGNAPPSKSKSKSTAKSKLKAKPTFARVVPESRPSVVVQIGIATVRVEAGFDAELLRTVVAALDGSKA